MTFEIGQENNHNYKVTGSKDLNDNSTKKAKIGRSIIFGFIISLVPLIIIPFLNILSKNTVTLTDVVNLFTQTFGKFEIIFIGVSQASAMIAEKTFNKYQRILRGILIIAVIFGTAVYTAILVKNFGTTTSVLIFNCIYIFTVLVIAILLKLSINKGDKQ